MIFKDIQGTIEIDLNKSLEELWKNADKDARWGVNKARKEGLKIDFPQDESEKNYFYNLYKDTMVWNRLVPKKKEELNKKISKLFLCKKQGEIVAGAAIEIKDNKTILFLNASNSLSLCFTILLTLLTLSSLIKVNNFFLDCITN